MIIHSNMNGNMVCRSLHKWWAQYMESLGEMDSALQFYEMAQDYLSLVRVYCYCGNMDKVEVLMLLLSIYIM